MHIVKEYIIPVSNQSALWCGWWTHGLRLTGGVTIMPKEDVSKGFNCSQCKKYHAYTGYVYAHTNIELTHTCDECGAKHIIIDLNAYPEETFDSQS